MYVAIGFRIHVGPLLAIWQRGISPHSELLRNFRRLPPASDIHLGRNAQFLAICDAARYWSKQAGRR